MEMQIDFISLDSGEIRTMDSKSDNVEIMMSIETDDIVNELFESFFKRYQEETKMKGSNFVFESVDFLYYRLHKISLSRGGSYIDSPSWLKNKRATMNPQNKDNECFKYVITVALNHERIKKTHKEYQKLSFSLINIIGRR